MTIYSTKECDFKDEHGKKVSFVKVLYETEKDCGVAIAKGSPEKIQTLKELEKPFTLDSFYDIVRVPNKMARLYIF